MYDKKGFTIDFWTHVPTLMDPERGWTDNGVSSQHRLVLACDNVGIASGATAQGNVLRLAPDLGEDVVRGFVMGFTRDARMVSGSDPINSYTCTSTLNSSSNIGFYVATTQSRDATSAGFISSGAGTCASGVGWHKWFYNVTSVGPSGVKFKDVAKEYMNIALTVDPGSDEVKVYLDSNLIATSGINAVFGTKSYEPPKLPSFYRDNSFEYSSLSVGPSAGIDLSSGPRLNPFFTPWIIGGGYTDGFASGSDQIATPSGNFMGGEYGGVRSGLRGHLGGMKFYRKPLNQGEIHKNFQAQQPFFKNIRTVNPLKGRLFFLLGGENAAGQADLSSIPDASGTYATKKFENVYIWNPRTSPDEARWDHLEAGYNNKGYDTSWGAQTKFGPELSMASALSVAYPNENIYIAKLAASGAYTATSTNGQYGAGNVARPSWSHLEVETANVDASNCLFNMVLSATTDSGYSKIQGLGVSSQAEPFLKARGNELLQVCGIFYVNGESDAGSIANHALGYKGNIQNFVSRMRHDLTALSWIDDTPTDIPFIQTVIHNTPTGNITASAAVLAAQLNVTSTIDNMSNLTLSSFATLQSNNRDLDASSLLQLGDSLVETYLDTIS